MGIFGSLYVGASGLQTSQNALNTVAHNMTNVDTEGYTRQQVRQSTRYYNIISKSASANAYQQVGLGVKFAEVAQVRDYFLDKSYRREHGREGFYNISCDAIEEVEEIFQELDGEAFADTLKNIWESVEEIAKDPSNTVNQGILVQRCNEFINRSQLVYQDLASYQDDLNFDVEQKTKRINEIGKRIDELNQAILRIEASEVEHANDLNDERNRLVDELSELANISLDTDVDGNYLIQIEGVDFVNVGSVKEMELYTDPVTGFHTPYWKMLAKYDADGNPTADADGNIIGRVFNMDREISSDMNTDIGSLKGLLLARGDKRTTYADMKADPADYPAGATQSEKDALDAKAYAKIKDSVVMNVMAEFDKLVNQVTTGINSVLYEAALFGNGYTKEDLPDGTYQIKSKDGTATYTKDPDTGKWLDGGGNEPVFEEGDYLVDPDTKKPYTMFNLTDDAPNGPGFTTTNLTINETLRKAPSKLGFIRPDGKADHEFIGDALKSVFASEIYTLNPDVRTTTNLTNYYNNLISQVSNTGYVMRGISANQTITVTNIRSAREEILGVSSDEELSNMIQFQNAFNASSRYVNAINEMIEHIITTLGR